MSAVNTLQTANGSYPGSNAMPLYEYACGACGHQFEVMQKLSDRPIRKCEACGRLKAKRVISQVSFVLKGSGWYVTDYGGKKNGVGDKPADKPAESDSKTDKKADSKSDSGSSKSEPSPKAANA
jgi:putative FmdB family regulatory protein